MAVEEKVEVEGEVIEALKNLNFRVKLDMGHEVLAHLAGKMRRFRIRVLPGDRVRVEAQLRKGPIGGQGPSPEEAANTEESLLRDVRPRTLGSAVLPAPAAADGHPRRRLGHAGVLRSREKTPAAGPTPAPIEN